jgi:hypothetical protein
MTIKKSLIGLALFGCAISTQAKQTVCVFDPVGKSGDAFALAKDYALEAKSGVQILIYALMLMSESQQKI